MFACPAQKVFLPKSTRNIIPSVAWKKLYKGIPRQPMMFTTLVMWEQNVQPTIVGNSRNTNLLFRITKGTSA